MTMNFCTLPNERQGTEYHDFIKENGMKKPSGETILIYWTTMCFVTRVIHPESAQAAVPTIASLTSPSRFCGNVR